MHGMANGSITIFALIVRPLNFLNCNSFVKYSVVHYVAYRFMVLSIMSVQGSCSYQLEECVVPDACVVVVKQFSIHVTFLFFFLLIMIVI